MRCAGGAQLSVTQSPCGVPGVVWRAIGRRGRLVTELHVLLGECLRRSASVFYSAALVMCGWADADRSRAWTLDALPLCAHGTRAARTAPCWWPRTPLRMRTCC
jgi:hypothetical protein